MPLEPLNMHGHANTWEEELDEVCRQRDALRAEVEELQNGVMDLEAENERLERKMKAHRETAAAAITGAEKQVDALRAEVEELQNGVMDLEAENERLTEGWRQETHAKAERDREIERLRAALRKIAGQNKSSEAREIADEALRTRSSQT